MYTQSGFTSQCLSIQRKSLICLFHGDFVYRQSQCKRALILIQTYIALSEICNLTFSVCYRESLIINMQICFVRSERDAYSEMLILSFFNY
jgi:hypothetical protein